MDILACNHISHWEETKLLYLELYLMKVCCMDDIQIHAKCWGWKMLLHLSFWNFYKWMKNYNDNAVYFVCYWVLNVISNKWKNAVRLDLEFPVQITLFQEFSRSTVWKEDSIIEWRNDILPHLSVMWSCESFTLTL